MTQVRRQPFLPSLAAAAALHALVVGWLWLRPAPAREVRRPPTLVRLVARPPPAAPPAAREPVHPEPPRQEPQRPRRASTRPPERVARAEPPPTRSEPPPRAAPSDAPPPPGPQAPRRFAVSMDAVVPGATGGVAMPTTSGPSAPRGDPRLRGDAPAGDNTAYAQSDATEIDRFPVVLSQPSAEALRRYYPEQARRQGLEGNVRIELLVGDAGTVEQLRIVGRGGNGFDEAVLAASDALRARFRFRPAQRNGRPVAVWIPWTIKFRLDG